MNIELEKRKALDPSNKVTVYLDPEMHALYVQGKENGWDTPALARKAIHIALMQQSDKLKDRAKP